MKFVKSSTISDIFMVLLFNSHLILYRKVQNSRSAFSGNLWQNILSAFQQVEKQKMGFVKNVWSGCE